MSGKRTKKEQELLRVLGKSITSYANKKGVSLERVGYEAGVSKGYIYDIAKGLGNPSYLVLIKIADSLGVDISELF